MRFPASWLPETSWRMSSICLMVIMFSRFAGRDHTGQPKRGGTCGNFVVLCIVDFFRVIFPISHTVAPHGVYRTKFWWKEKASTSGTRET